MAEKKLMTTFSANDNLSGTLSSIAEKGREAASALDEGRRSMDFWTSSAESYDKSALEAVYSTQELVETGYKTSGALDALAEAQQRCEKESDYLNSAVKASKEIQDELTAAMESAKTASEAAAESEGVSAKAKEEFALASEEAEKALREQTAAQEEAKATAENYAQVLESGTENLAELESAAERNCHAAENLAEANENASLAAEKLTTATEELGEEAKNTGEQSEKAGKSGKEAIETVSAALTAAGITKIVKEGAEACLEFSEAAEQTETAYAKLQTIAGESSMATLKAEIKELSGETGILQEDLSDVAYNAISAGTAIEESAETASAASKLAAAGFTETSSALSVLETAMNSYGDSAGTAAEISDSLIMVQNLGVTTIADLAANMGKSISTAAAYSVSLGNLESAYVSVTKAGINTAEATTYISAMINELGKEGSNVATILTEKTGMSFGQLMNEGYTLADVLEILYEAAGKDAEAMMNLWSSQTAGVASAAIVNQGLEQFNTNLVTITNSAGATEKAYSVMADTTAHAHEKMTTASENLSTAIGGNLNPAFKRLYESEADLLNMTANFAEEHPIIVKGLAAILTGLWAVTLGVTAYTTVTKVAIPAIIEFGTVVNGALGPIGWAAAGISVAVTAIAAFAAMIPEATSETEGLTVASKEQYYELEDLKAQYEEMTAKGDELSTESLRLKNQIEDLTAEFEANKMTVEELVSSTEEAIDKDKEIRESYSESVKEISDYQTETYALAQRFEDLALAADGASDNTAQMESVYNKLSDRMPYVGMSFAEAAADVDKYTTSIKGLAEEEARQKRLENNNATATDLELQKDILEEKKKLLQDEVDAEEEKLQEQQRLAAEQGLTVAYQPTDNLKAASDALKDVNAELEENAAELEKINAETEILNNLKENELNDADTWEKAKAALDKYANDGLTGLKEKYNEVYGAAYDSISGQIGLFEQMSTECTTTADELLAALQSQTEYINNYAENLRLATEYGFDSSLVEQLSDGSKESAQYLQAMADKVKQLGEGSDAAKNYVANFNKEFENTKEAKDNFAQTVADMDEDFKVAADSIVSECQNMVEQMSLDDEAKTAALETINSYIENIKSGASEAYLAGKSVADAASDGLNSGGGSTTDEEPAENATGGIYNRPLLTWVAEGGDAEAIIPLNDTQRAFDLWQEAGAEIGRARGGFDTGVLPKAPQLRETVINSESKNTSIFERTMVLKIEGGGEITLPKAVSKNEVVDLLSENLKPLLLDMLNQEIFEEGEGEYDT